MPYRESLRAPVAKRLAPVLLCLGLLGSAGPAASAPPPLEAFGKREMISDVLVSPGGTHYAALQWFDGKEVIAIYNLYPKSDKDRARFLNTDASKRVEERVEQIFWVGDDRLAAVYQWEGRRGTFNIPVAETRLISMNVDLSDIRQIPKPRNSGSYVGQIQHRVVDFLPQEPDHILMELDREGMGRTLNVYRVNVKTGGLKGIETGGSNVSGYWTDHKSRLRLRQSIRQETAVIAHRPIGSSNWEDLFEYVRTEGSEYWPVAFSGDTDLIVRRDGEHGFEELLTYNIASRDVTQTLRSSPKRDVIGIRLDPYTRAVTGYVSDGDGQSTEWVDPVLQKIQNTADAARPGYENSILNYDRAREKFIIYSRSPRDPGAYFMHLRSTGQFVKILNRNAVVLSPSDLGTMKQITYTARDGQEIPAYLTTPPNGKAPYPLVVLPHGGPTARDYLQYDYWVQFLASRGYAVLQPQFRGSSGFGRAFQEAGYAEWGLLMQDDVTDGTRAMIEEGLADPGRICIVGGSYGGYTALMGTIVEPELYQCAVSFAGVTDIPRLIDQGFRYKFATANPPNVGHRKDDGDQLRETSPIRNIDVITTPILLVHGDKDLSVDINHSKRMASALKKAGKPHKLVVLKDGNHYLMAERHRIRFLKEMEAFLSQHIEK